MVVDDSGQALGDGNEWCFVRFLTGSSFAENTTKTYHAYYFNSLATEPSYSDLFIYGENYNDFDNTSWDTYNLRGFWNITDGVRGFWYNGDTSGGSIGTEVLISNTTAICDFTVTMDVQHHNYDNSTDTLGIYMRDHQVDYLTYGYELLINTRDDLDLIQLDRATQNSTSVTRNAYEWYDLKGSLNNGNIEFYVNDNLQLTLTDTTYECTNVGFSRYLGGFRTVDWSSLWLDNYCLVNDPNKECYVYNTSISTSLGSEEVNELVTTTTIYTGEIESIMIDAGEGTGALLTGLTDPLLEILLPLGFVGITLAIIYIIFTFLTNSISNFGRRENE
jgi:hypothetical protein